jgi:prepilin-type processing-associated H-X9-DG protein
MNSRVRLADVTDGTSTTLLVGERPPSPDNRFGWWYAGIGQMGDGSADSHLGVRETVQSVRAPMCAGLAPPYGPGIADNMCDAFHFWSRHPGGSEFLFVDGAVHFISYSAKDLLPALATRAGGEPAELP